MKKHFFVFTLLVLMKIHSASIIPLSDPDSSYILRMDPNGNALAFWGDRYAYSPVNQTFTTSYKLSTFSTGLFNAAFNNLGDLFLIWEEVYRDSSLIKYTFKTSDQILKASEIKTLNLANFDNSFQSITRYCESKNCFFVLMGSGNTCYLLEFKVNQLDQTPVITEAFTSLSTNYENGWFDIDANGNALIAAVSNPAVICTDPSLISYRYKPYGAPCQSVKTISPSSGAYFDRFIQVSYNKSSGNSYWMINYKESQIEPQSSSIKAIVTNQELTTISPSRTVYTDLHALIAKKADDNFIIMFNDVENALVYNFFSPSTFESTNIDPTTGAISFPLDSSKVNYTFSNTTFYKNSLGLFFSFYRTIEDENNETRTSILGDAFLPASSKSFTINNPNVGYGESRFAAGSSRDPSYTRVIWGSLVDKYIFSNAPANAASLLNFFKPSLKVQKGIYK